MLEPLDFTRMLDLASELVDKHPVLCWIVVGLFIILLVGPATLDLIFVRFPLRKKKM